MIREGIVFAYESGKKVTTEVFGLGTSAVGGVMRASGLSLSGEQSGPDVGAGGGRLQFWGTARTGDMALRGFMGGEQADMPQGQEGGTLHHMADYRPQPPEAPDRSIGGAS